MYDKLGKERRASAGRWNSEGRQRGQDLLGCKRTLGSVSSSSKIFYEQNNTKQAPPTKNRWGHPLKDVAARPLLTDSEIIQPVPDGSSQLDKRASKNVTCYLTAIRHAL